ncbi:hypothetical protein K503DRAFT_770533 [Rhizopogon vinicolor AM-OR11-026]|uniref:Uncharacterized protein n=1 Tax=Rhizopogon vinicolor AM-OR11-026 TaxID=1314800 RepID=A0A1B7N0Q6_9AGAM|nr:hypothetical protein K503DRAFT_770533 [Rhizopogon vinicolor AM-OR11-026]
MRSLALKEQVRVTDPGWLDLLQHVRHGSYRPHHIKLLRSLIITDCHGPASPLSPLSLSSLLSLSLLSLLSLSPPEPPELLMPLSM